MFYYVSTERVSDETLQFLGYLKIDENEEFIIYSHLGTEIIVDKMDKILRVDDFNDAQLMGSEMFKVGKS